MKAIALLLTCALLVVLGAPFYQAEASSQPSSAAVQEGGKKKRSLDNVNDLKLERRAGEAVKFRADQLKRKNKDVAKAMSALEGRGMRLAANAGMTIVAARKSGHMAKISKQDTTIIDGDYELTFISYDDGNNATWEGVIYFKRPEGEVIYDAQFDITNAAPVVLHQQRYGGIDGTTKLIEVAKNMGSLQLLPISYNSGQPFSAATFQGSALQEWAQCAAAGCWAGALGCRLAGPYWAHCAAAACLAVMFGCALDALW